MGVPSVAGLLADDARRRVFGALALGRSTHAEILEVTGLAGPAMNVAIDRLVNAGLVRRDADHLEIDLAFLEVEARRPRPVDPGVPVGEDAEAAAVVRTFFRDGRLTHLPTQAKKRLVVLDVLAQAFEPGQLYSEKRVNLELGKFHADVAALRRALVDNQFLERRDGMYWRAGGTVEIDAVN